MPEIPTCECVAALPLEGKFDAIYCALISKITNPVELPTCQCVRGLPLNGKLDAIFCAILQLDGGGGGEITLSQISDLEPSWIPVLQTAFNNINVPLANIDGLGAGWLAVLGDMLSNFTITASQISDATPIGLDVIKLPLPTISGPIIAGDDNTAYTLTSAFTGTLSPVVSVEFNMGVGINGS